MRYLTRYVCHCHRTDRVAAGINTFRSEMELWSTLRHPSIVRWLAMLP